LIFLASFLEYHLFPKSSGGKIAIQYINSVVTNDVLSRMANILAIGHSRGGGGRHNSEK